MLSCEHVATYVPRLTLFGPEVAPSKQRNCTNDDMAVGMVHMYRTVRRTGILPGLTLALD